MFYNIKKYQILRIGYTLLLFVRARGLKICVFRRKILILHAFLRFEICNMYIKS